MSYDANKKTLRYFQCRDYLWDAFERMSADLACSTDYLINEAMRQFWQDHQQGGRSSAPPQDGPQQGASPAIPSLGGPTQSVAPSHGNANYAASNSAQPTAGHNVSGGHHGPSFPPPLPHPGGSPSPAVPSQAVPSQVGPPRAAPPPAGHSAPSEGGRSYGAGRHQPHASTSQQGHLCILFNGQRIPVTKDEFIIGRSAKTADLAIKDSNISRRHAAIVRNNNGFIIRDLGSTNGIEFRGQRIDSKPIDEGDVVQLCDFELTFTYR